LQPFIADALKKVVTIFKENETTLKSILSESKDVTSVKEFHRQLLAYLIAGGGDQNLHAQVYDKLSQITCLRHSEGMYSVTLDRETLDFLSEKGLHSGANGQFLAMNTNSGVYRFVLFQENDKDEDYLKSTKLHEFHHFLYMALEESMGIRGSTEQDEIVSKGFIEFRDEMVAYLINYSIRGTFDFGGLHAQDMAPINGNEYAVSKRIYELLNVVEICCRQAQQQGVSAEVFIYPVLTSRSFSEMKARVQRVVEQFPTVDNLNTDPEDTKQNSSPLRRIRKLFGGK
jgi:hypothetical protein